MNLQLAQFVTGSVTSMRYDGLKTNEGGRHD